MVSEKFSSTVTECGEVAVEGRDSAGIYLIHQFDIRQAEVGEIVLCDVEYRIPKLVLKCVVLISIETTISARYTERKGTIPGNFTVALARGSASAPGGNRG
jgi:hypothetical protein